MRLKRSPIQVFMVYYEPFPSGQTTHVFSVAKGLDRSRFQVEVLIPDILSSTADKFLTAGIKVVQLPIRKTFWKPQAIFYLLRSVKKQPGAIVHIHSQEAALVARPLAKLAGARHILYTPQTIDIRRKQVQKLYSGLERSLAWLTERIISVNETDRQRMISWGIPPEKLVTIYNGVSLDSFEQSENPATIRQSLGLKTNCPLVMQIGRLSAQKSPQNFIEGAALILQMRPEVQFLLVGDGPLFSTVQQRILELGLQRSIKLAGWHDQAFRLIPAADIVTLTSLWEGAPYSILEAMAWEKPVVATAINGCPEIIVNQQSGFLVPPDQPDQWAQAVLKLLDDPFLAETYGHLGRQRVEERFTLENMIDALERLYEGIMGD